MDDIKAAARSLRSSPAFTTIALTVLALGIGAATAIFSIVDAVVLRALPFDEHDRLGVVLEKDTKRATTLFEGSVTAQTYLDWRSGQRPFQALTAIGPTSLRLKTEGGEPADARAQRVTWEFFPVLRVAPRLGRAFTDRDEVAGGHHVVILTYGFWQRRFGGLPDVVGKTIDLSDEPYEIVGVMPRAFSYPVGSDRPAEVLAPLMFSTADRVKGTGHTYNYTVVGRLKDGVSFRQASDEMWRLSEQLDSRDPAWAPGRRAHVITLHDHLVGRVRGWMLMLLGAVVLVLLIACANVANLMLVRAAGRSRELSVRAALGAGPWRLVRGLLVEGFLIAAGGAVIGIVLAYGGIAVLRAWFPAGIPRVASIGIDMRVLGAAVAAALFSGLFFGSVPAVQAVRPDLTGALKEGGRGSGIGARVRRLGNLLVVSEVALAVVLLVGAGLFIGSFVRLMRVDPGFGYHNVIGLNIWLRPASGQKFDAEFSARNTQYVRQVVERVSRVPGAEMVATVSGGLPLTGAWSRTRVTLPGRGELTGEGDDMERRVVSPNYLQLLRVPILEGRHLTDADRGGATPVIVINEAAARRYWPGQRALGQHVTIGTTDRLVVGIVENIHDFGPDVAPRPECYIPDAQDRQYGATIVVRTAGDPMAVVPAVKAAIWSVNREQRLTETAVTLEAYMDRLIAQRRFNMAVLALFGALGLVIAAVGIYGVMAYVVSQRTNEIGVRMALGATRGTVIRMVIGQAGVLLLAGLGIGTAAAWYLGAGVKAFLFDVQPNDIRILGGALVALAAAGLAASAVPARRAASVDPLIALKSE